MATGDVATVGRCRECGCLSVHIGALTLRLEAGALSSLHETLEDALTTMAARSPGSIEIGWAREAPRGSA